MAKTLGGLNRITVAELQKLPDREPVLLRLSKPNKDLEGKVFTGIRHKIGSHLLPLPGTGDMPLMCNSPYIKDGTVKIYSIDSNMCIPTRLVDLKKAQITTPQVFFRLASYPKEKYRRVSDGIEISIDEMGCYKWGYTAGRFFQPEDVWERVCDTPKLFNFHDAMAYARQFDPVRKIKYVKWARFCCTEDAWKLVSGTQYEFAKAMINDVLWTVEGVFEDD